MSKASDLDWFEVVRETCRDTSYCVRISVPALRCKTVLRTHVDTMARVSTCIDPLHLCFVKNFFP